MNQPVDFGPALAEFSRDISLLSLSPLWERQARMKPGSECVPALWKYSALRPHLMRSTELITKKQAERRVLMLENPSLRGTTFISLSLFTGLQIILPGEIAPSHRHSPSALRFIVEGQGAYTAVEGERTMMSPGDFVVTPNWTWHDHGNLGDKPVVWMDGLDTPLAAIFGAMFREDHPSDTHPLTRQEGDALARYGNSMLPVDYQGNAPGGSTPLLIYPYARTREALYQLAKSTEPDAVCGHKLRYAHPGTGGHVFPTMAVYMQYLPQGFSGKAARSTESAVYNVVEGRGSVFIGEAKFEFEPHDIFVVPPWEPCRFEAPGECVLFSYTDRAAQEALGFYREQK
ncbi:MAG: gentisate 1,2-dioxygenase [Burkholderiales bacterium]